MSLCSYCGQRVLWIRKPSGSWFPPFDTVEELETMDYEVSWDAQTQDWVAAPTDIDLTANLTRHVCEAYETILETKRQKRMAELMAVPEPQVEKVVEFVEVPTYRNPDPVQYIQIAARLYVKCPTCGAGLLEWCTYKNDPEKFTSQLHTSRRVQ